MKRRPTGSTAAVASMLVAIAQACGLDLTVEQAVAIVGGITALVSIFTPLPTENDG